MNGLDRYDDLLRSLAAATPESKQTERKEKIGSGLPKTSREFAWFRYLLTLLLVAVKLGVFSIEPNPLADVSWFLVALPAYAVELIVGILILAGFVGGLTIAAVITVWRKFFSVSQIESNGEQPPFGNQSW